MSYAPSGKTDKEQIGAGRGSFLQLRVLERGLCNHKIISQKEKGKI